jgi:plastocyanin
VRVDGRWKMSATLAPASASHDSGARFSSAARSSSRSSSSAVSSVPVRRFRGTGCQCTWRRAAASALIALALSGCGGAATGSGASGASGHGGSKGAAGRSAGSGSTSGSGSHGKVEFDSAKGIRYAKVPSSAATQSGTVEIAYRDIAIEPDVVRVKLGSTIEWTNHDSVPANVTSEGGPLEFASGTLAPGASYRLHAGKTGVIHYECTLEPTTMNGTIEVVE